MDFRQIKKEDVRAFYDCMKAIDQETEYMLYEPDERVWNQDLLEGKIEREQDFLVGALKKKTSWDFYRQKEVLPDEFNIPPILWLVSKKHIVIVA